MASIFHKAAKDGNLNVLKECSKWESNSTDDDGATPLSCAAHAGNLNALRLLVVRGGNPEKCDYYGNTSLHCAAAQGHLSCVTYLVNFGINIWKLNSEFHSAKDLASLNNRKEVLKFLDSEAAKQIKNDAKKVKRILDRCKKDAERRKNYMEKWRMKNDQKMRSHHNSQTESRIIARVWGSISKSLLKNSASRMIHSKSTTSKARFSDLTKNEQKSLNTIDKIVEIKNSINRTWIKSKLRESSKIDRDSTRHHVADAVQRDSEIFFVPSGSLSSGSSQSPNYLRRRKMKDLFTPEVQHLHNMSHLSRTISEPDFKQNIYGTVTSSIFNRPGFGSVAFRNSVISCTLNAMKSCDDLETEQFSDDENSQSDFALNTWLEEDLLVEEAEKNTEVIEFLSSNGFDIYIPLFSHECLDMEAMMLLTDQDLEALQLPLGHRRKILKILNERRMQLHSCDEICSVKL